MIAMLVLRIFLIVITISILLIYISTEEDRQPLVVIVYTLYLIYLLFS